MNLRKFGAAALLTAMFLDLAGTGALADPLPPVPPVPVIVTPDTTPAPSLTTSVTVPSSSITSTTATTVTPSAPAVTTTTNTTVPSTTVQVPLPTPTPIVQITTTQPVTVGSTTTVSPTTSTPLTGGVTVGGPGTTGSVPIATTISPVGGTITVRPQPLPDIRVNVPTIPTVTASHTTPIDTDGTQGSAANNSLTETAAVRTDGTGAGATVTEPANGIAVNARAAAAICLLANAVGRTTLDPAATAYLSTLCDGSASTADGTAGATAGPLASGSVGLAASICLVANALAITSPIVPTSPLVSSYLASAGLDSRCGTGPSTADIDSTATALNNATVAASGATAACLIASAQAGVPSSADLDTRCATGSDLGPSTADIGSTTTLLGSTTLDAGGAAAVCLIASALAGVPASADLSTACGAANGLSPSVLSGGANGTTPLGNLNGDLSAALCVVARAVGDLPTTAALTTACGNLPTSVSGNGGVDLPGAGGNVAPDAATCIAVDGTVPGLTSIGQTCGTPAAAAPVSGGTRVLGSETGPGRDIGSIDLITEPAGAVRGEQSAPQGDNSLLAQLGITSLPSTATALGGGALGLALIGLGIAFMRRRRTT